MEIMFEEIEERDIDLLVMGLFSKSEVFLHEFCAAAAISLPETSKVISIEHSFADSTGESDVTVIVKDADCTLGLLIENKISALPQPDQKKRYYDRGNNGISANKYEKFFVILIAPEIYCANDTQGYEHKVTYEQIIDAVKDAKVEDAFFCIEMLKRAIYKKERENGYTMIPHDGATDFVNGYIAYWRENAFDMQASIKTKEGKAHPSNGGWIDFSVSGLKGLSITHKADRGYVDLTFNKCKGMTEAIHTLLVATVDNPERYEVLDLMGASAAVRLKCHAMQPKQFFDGQQPEAYEGMKLVVELTNLAKRFDWKEVNELIARGAEKNKGRRR